MAEQDYKNSDTPEQVEYNLSSFKIGWIAELIRQADIHYLQGRINNAFECWNCIYGQISNRIKEGEDKRCKGIEKNCRISLNKLNSKAEKSFYYGRYKRFLQILLKTYGFDMKIKESEEHLV